MNKILFSLKFRKSLKYYINHYSFWYCILIFYSNPATSDQGTTWINSKKELKFCPQAKSVTITSDYFPIASQCYCDVGNAFINICYVKLLFRMVNILKREDNELGVRAKSIEPIYHLLRLQFYILV